MPRAKRLVIIEENYNQGDTPQIINLILHIRNTQIKLLKDVFKDIPAGTPLEKLIKTFDGLITNEILNYPTKKTFDSIESINKRFDSLLTDFENISQQLKMAETHHSLCEGLQLLIQLYRIQAIEVFLYKPLASELAITESKVEAKVSLQDRFDVLIQKINNFNSQVEEIEEGLEYYKSPIVNTKIADLKTMLQPLLIEETRLNILPNQAKVLEKLGQERLVLVKNLEDLRQEMERDIAACEESLKNAKQEREKLYDSTLGIDVYYVDEFKKKYKEIFDSYKKLLMCSKQRDEYLRIDAIEKHLQHFSDPFRKYELSLSEYYTNYISNEYYTNHISTLYYSVSSYLYNWVSSYYSTINGVYKLLTQQFSAFKLNSAMLRLEAQYQQPYEYFRVDLPELERNAKEKFVLAAKEYLGEVATLDDAHRALISSQAKEDFENEVFNDTLKIRPSSFIPEIKSFIPKALKRDKLNQNWNEVFHHIFTTELQEIKSQFDTLSGQSESDLALLKKMESRVRTKRKELDAILDNDQYPKVCEILDSIYLEINFDPIILTVRERIQNLEKSLLPTQQEHKSLPLAVITSPVKPFIKPALTTTPATNLSLRPQQSNPEGGLPHPAKSTTGAMTSLVCKQSSWYASLTDKKWKRAVLYGLFAFVCVMLAFTVWGLIAEMSAGAIIMGGLGFGGMGFSVVSGIYYVGQKCCCKKTSAMTGEDNEPPLHSSVPYQAHPVNINADQKHSRPIVSQANKRVSNPESIRSHSSNGGLALFDRRPVVEMSESLLRKSSTSRQP